MIEKVQLVTQPLVSVIVAARNAESTLGQAVNSCLSQDYPNLEVIIVDDGSTDSTWDLCERLRRSDHRVKPVRVEWGGQGIARNFAVGVAQGTYITILDADDELVHSSLSSLVSVAERFQSDVVLGEMLEVTKQRSRPITKFATGDNNERVSTDAKRKILRRAHYTQGKLYRTDYLRCQRIGFGEGYIYEDCEFLFGALWLSDRVTFLAQPTYRRHRRIGSTTEPIHRSFAHIEDLRKSFKSIVQKYPKLAAREAASLNQYMLSRVAHYTVIQRRVPASCWFQSVSLFLKEASKQVPAVDLGLMSPDIKLSVLVYDRAPALGAILFLLTSAFKKVAWLVSRIR
jgi:glycosyltransferase involved in cell wall biosynthesis